MALGFVILSSGCNTIKRLAKDEVLLQKNRIKYTEPINVDQDALTDVIRQEPNRKLLGVFPFYVWAYNVPNPDKFEKRNAKRLKKLEKKNAKRREKGKDELQLKPFGSWWRETVGEAPVVYDSSATNRSTEQLETYLLKHGWFNAKVSSDIKFKKDSTKAEVTYIIEPKKAYTIRSLDYSIPDSALQAYTFEARDQRKEVRVGDRFNIDKLEKERVQLTTYFRDRGYYDFNKVYIYFDVDSSLNSHQVDLTLGIIPRKVPYEGDPDSLLVAPYKRYQIDQISVIDLPGIRTLDITNSDTIVLPEYTFIDQYQLRVKPKIIAQNILFRSGDYYDLSKTTRTYRRITSLPIVRSASIQYSPVSEDIDNTRLNCRITITPAPKQNISFEWKGTNRGGFLGIAGSARYQNKNVFGGAELFNFSLSGGIEAQQLLTQSESASSESNLGNDAYFNTVEFGPEISLTFPRFLLPFGVDKFSKSSNPKTVLTANLSYQRRPDYERTRSFGSIAYKWSSSADDSWSFSPLEVSLISITRSAEFDRQLEQIGDPFLTNSFQDHFIVDSRLVYTYNTQRFGTRKKNLYYYRAEFETAGNVLRGLFDLSNAEKNENGSYEIMGIQFAQYVKTLHDFRYYRNHNQKMSTAYRFSGGIGVPLRNLDVLPFEKAFFGGGANDIRAWQARTLGPGSFRDPERSFDKLGDILLQAQVEYRFDLIDVLEGALFVDAGNIWTINADEARPGADFEFNRFLSEIAVGVGAGARFNFDFFLIRLDVGLQMKDPALDPGERWLFQPKEQYNDYIRQLNEDRDPSNQLSTYRWRWNLNLGIGLPF